MKNIVFYASAITFTFVMFAFTPAEKNNEIDRATVTEVAVAPGRCVEHYESNTTFTRCRKTYTEPEPEPAPTDESAVLSLY